MGALEVHRGLLQRLTQSLSHPAWQAWVTFLTGDNPLVTFLWEKWYQTWVEEQCPIQVLNKHIIAWILWSNVWKKVFPPSRCCFVASLSYLEPLRLASQLYVHLWVKISRKWQEFPSYESYQKLNETHGTFRFEITKPLFQKGKSCCNQAVNVQKQPRSKQRDA